MVAVPPGGEVSVVVVGGGLTGLTTAYALQQQALQQQALQQQALQQQAREARDSDAGKELTFTLLEQGERWGGNLVTERVDGFLVEGGADSFIARKPWAMELAAELGLAKDIVQTPPSRGRVYVLRRGKLVPLPKGMRFVVPTQPWPLLRSPLLSLRGKLRMGLERWVPKRKTVDDDSREESLGDFVRRRFGREALEVIGEPLMAGIHAADPEKLSLQAAFPEVAALEQSYGSLIQGMKAVHSSLPARSRTQNSSRVTLAGGVQQLVDGLLQRLDPSALRLRSRVTGIERQGEGFAIDLEGGERLKARAVVLALPAFAASKLVAHLDVDLGAALATIPYISSATVSLGFRTDHVARPMDALGFVIPGGESSQLQACTWSSAKFEGRAPAGHVLLRAFVGGARNEELVERSDEDLVSLVLSELRPIMRLSGEPVLTRIHRWRQGIPQYHLGHLDRVSRIESHGVQGLFLAGNAYRGVGLPDCIRSGRQAAEAATELLLRP